MEESEENRKAALPAPAKASHPNARAEIVIPVGLLFTSAA